jgi:hypothetical protein
LLLGMQGKVLGLVATLGCLYEAKCPHGLNEEVVPGSVAGVSQWQRSNSENSGVQSPLSCAFFATSFGRATRDPSASDTPQHGVDGASPYYCTKYVLRTIVATYLRPQPSPLSVAPLTPSPYRPASSLVLRTSLSLIQGCHPR